jgi:hypothetical protein
MTMPMVARECPFCDGITSGDALVPFACKHCGRDWWEESAVELRDIFDRATALHKTEPKLVRDLAHRLLQL